MLKSLWNPVIVKILQISLFTFFSTSDPPLAPHIFKKAEENAKTGAADIFQSAAFDQYIFIRIFMQGCKLLFAFSGLKSVEASFERSDDFAGFFS